MAGSTRQQAGMATDYPHIAMFIDGDWIDRPGEEVLDPATEERIGSVPHATSQDLDRALEAAARGFAIWRDTAPGMRAEVLQEAARLLRERAGELAPVITLEQGKPLADAQHEVLRGADLLAWDAEEARRSYGRIIPAAPGLRQMVVREPIGPVAAFTPWSTPLSTAARKVGGALAAGCSIVLKAAEETPGGACSLVRCLQDAGVPPGVVGLVFGVPAEVSQHLITSPVIRLVTFTGSVPVGIHLAQLSAARMKPAVMELGGHSPVIVCPDVNPSAVARMAAQAKIRNAGQVCISPTRFYVHESVHDAFVEVFVEQMASIRVGNGLDEGVAMGPLANDRRVRAMEEFVDDAVERGTKVSTGGGRIGSRGHFFQPTVVSDPAPDSRVMTVEPFGPIAATLRFRELDEVIEQANAGPYGLAAYAFTDSARIADRLSTSLQAGHVAINHFGGGLPESPFGGVKESGIGREGGLETQDAFLVTKFVTHRMASPRS